MPRSRVVATAAILAAAATASIAVPAVASALTTAGGGSASSPHADAPTPAAAASSGIESTASISDPTGDVVRYETGKKSASDVTEVRVRATASTITLTYEFANHRKGTTPAFNTFITPQGGSGLTLRRYGPWAAGLYRTDGDQLLCAAEVERDFGVGGTMQVRFARTCLPAPTPLSLDFGGTDVGRYNTGESSYSYDPVRRLLLSTPTS